MIRVVIKLVFTTAIVGMMAACSQSATQKPGSSELELQENESLNAVQSEEFRDLAGIWDVALYFDPSAPPSATILEISGIKENGELKGSFYQSPFSTGRARKHNDEIIISVVTSDGSGSYNTSGRLFADGRFEGQTLSIGREFLMPWTASRQNDE